MTCLCCGSCCSTIVTPPTHNFDFWRNEAINGKREADRIDSAFILDNWICTGVARRSDTDEIIAYRYRCKLLGDDNRCTDYEHRPPICRGFPLYGKSEPSPRALMPPWCGYRKSDYEGPARRETVQ